jgi:hypothetical protein
MLAERVEGDRAGHHQLVVALVVGEGGGDERQGGEQLGEGGRDPAGGVGQVLVGRVGPQRLQQRQGGPFGRLQVDPAEGRGDPEAAVGEAGHEPCREAAAAVATLPVGNASASFARARAPRERPKSRRAMSK